jgi:chromosomal replication initiator protein
VNEEIVSAQWNRVRGRLRDEFGEAAFKSWLNPLTLAEVRDGQVRIGVPTRFLRDWVVSNYSDRIRALWSKENAAIKAVDIVVLQVGLGKATAPVVPAAPAAPCEPAAAPGEEIGAPLDPRYVFDNFVVGKPNEFAYAAARRVAECTCPPRSSCIALSARFASRTPWPSRSSSARSTF